MVLIIGAGFGRTGTSSFKKAMEILGFGKCYHMKEAIHNNHIEQWIEISDKRDPKLIRDILDKGGYRSTCDMPSAVYWKEQLKVYPDAMVVLNMRDPEKWYKSWMDTVAYMQPDFHVCPFGIRIVLGLGVSVLKGFAEMNTCVTTRDTFHGDLSKKNMIKTYNLHVADVKSSCPPEKLLEFSYLDGWEPLCTFLKVPIPDVPYPNLNDTVAFRWMTFSINIIGWTIFILGCGIPGLYYARSDISEEKKKSSNIAA
jgi:Sulfotransferase domain